MFRGARLPSDPLEVRGALARVRGNAATLELTAREGADSRGLWAALYGALGTELERLIIRRTGEPIAVELHPNALIQRHLQVHADKLELVTVSGETAPLTWTLGDATGELAASLALTRDCAAAPCIVAFEMPEETNAVRMLPALVSWQRVTVGITSLHWSLGGVTALSGRLAPEVIQTVVRRHYPEVRKCYEGGLARNPKLEGKMTLRFVIERDGHVSGASDTSSFPDRAVSACVVHAFVGLSFPIPEGGIVTVVYPINLAHE